MKKPSLVLVSALILGLIFVPLGARAAHDDSTLIALRVTVGSVNPSTGDVTITVSATGMDSHSFGPTNGAYLGSQFLHDLNHLTVVTPALPAVDWGDGSTLGATNLPFTGTNGTINGYTRQNYRGQFSHTYGAPGSYTVRVAGMNVYNRSTEYQITSGNPVYATIWRFHTSGSQVYTYARLTTLAVSASTTASLVVVSTLGKSSLSMLALSLLALGAALLLWRRS